MYLYLVRHGEARRVEEDPSQGLSEKGLSDIRKMAAFLGGRDDPSGPPAIAGCGICQEMTPPICCT